MYIEDTIAAISTPPGEGGIGIVRVSGIDAEKIGLQLFRFKKGDSFRSHFLHYGLLQDQHGNRIDEAMAVLMRKPASYTCEDILELHCHGGLLVTEQVLQTVLASGARLAEPGEFTRRAFLNGRIDLLQAEAVIDTIQAKTVDSLRLAQNQSSGTVSAYFSEIADRLTKLLATVEAYIDFPDEEIGINLEYDTSQELSAIIAMLQQLLAGFDAGYLLREGVSIVIAGRPNVGKSSLLNRLLSENRAIVTDIPGTTRDLIEEGLNINGLPVRLVDTAGIRQTEDIVEQDGVQRAIKKATEADLALFVLDASSGFLPEDQFAFDALGDVKTLLVLNKSDLPPALRLSSPLDKLPQVTISANTGFGLDNLRHAISSTFLADSLDARSNPVTISRVRHRDAVQSAIANLKQAEAALNSKLGLEFVAIELREAVFAMGQVTGITTAEDVLDMIFSSFCIGK